MPVPTYTHMHTYNIPPHIHTYAYMWAPGLPLYILGPHLVTL